MRFNAVWASLLVAYSALVGISTSPSSCPASLSLGLLGLLEIFVGAFFTASTVHSITELGLLDPLARLPVEERTIRLAVLGAAVYWGGAVLPLAVLPAALILGVRLGSSGLVAWGILESLSTALLSIGGGFSAAALYPRAREARGSRLASLIAWTALFGLGATFNLALVRGWLSRGAGCPPHVMVLPPFSYPAASVGFRWANATSASFSILSALAAWYGVGHLWSALSEEWTPVPEFFRDRGGGSRPLPLPYPLVKDMKLLLRDPKLLASVAYYAAVGPALLGAAAILSPGREVAVRLPPASLLLGGLTGWVAVYLLVLEGSGAGFLATLPVGASEVTLFKSALSCLLCAPSAAGIAALGARLGSPLAGVASGVTYLLAVASSSSLIASRLIVGARDRGGELRSWSLHSVGGKETLMMLGAAALYAGLAWVGGLALEASARLGAGWLGWAACCILAALPATVAREVLSEPRPGT